MVYVDMQGPLQDKLNEKGSLEKKNNAAAKPSFKEPLLGSQSGGSSVVAPEDEGHISDDEIDGEYEDDAGCPIIQLSEEETSNINRESHEKNNWLQLSLHVN